MLPIVSNHRQEYATVYGYIFPTEPNKGPAKVALPEGAKVLSVIFDGHDFKIYAEVDPEIAKYEDLTVNYEFEIWGTGRVREYKSDSIFLGTVVLECGEVYHVYYRELD